MFRQAIVIFGLLSVLCGVVYPAVVTGIAQVAFPHQANGSLVLAGDAVIGSELIGQTFDRPEYFWSRPSAAGEGYDGASSGGSNQGPLNPALSDGVERHVQALGTLAPVAGVHGVPVDLVTASGSGLDPHISPAAAYVQVDRVAEARHLDAATVRALVDVHVEGRTLGVLGDPRVNVLALNRALDGSNP